MNTNFKMDNSLPDFNSDNYFFPLSNSEEIENHRNTKTKSEFNKFMKIEEKKVKYNETIENFASEYQIKRKRVLEIKDKIDSNEKLYIENINKTHTFTGTFDEIRENLLNYSQEITVKYKKPIQYYTNDLKYSLKNINNDFILMERISLIGRMDIFVNKFILEKKDREKQNEKDADWMRFLKNLDSLPDELLRIIRSYFTYETRAALLEKYQPIKLFKSLNKKKDLMNVIYSIYTRKYTSKFAKQLKDMWTILFKDKTISKTAYKSVTVKEMKIFIEYLFYTLNKHGASRICFKLYSAAVLYYIPPHERSSLVR